MGIAESIDSLVGHDLPFRLEADDGSAVGPIGHPLTVRILRRDAIARALTRPGELGLARAYAGRVHALLRPGGDRPLGEDRRQ